MTAPTTSQEPAAQSAPAPTGSGAPSASPRASTPWRLLRTLGRNGKAVVGLSILLIFLVLALLAPVLYPDDPSRIVSGGAQSPSAEHLLGTTAKGQDVLALTLWGSRPSLLVGFIVGTAATAIGMVIGLISAYFGRVVDETLSLLTNIFLLIPGLPLLVVLAAFLPQGLGTVIVVLIITGWAGTARVLRSQALSIRGKDYIDAAVVSGERTTRIAVRDMLPNMASIVMTTLLGSVIGAIGAQAGLEFLGLGDANTISWGNNLYWANTDGSLMLGQWWIFLPSGLAIALVAFALALCNYAVDELTNPRLRRTRSAARRRSAPTAGGPR
ncbi:ABC transporter permease [Nesterenkonia sp. CL21]|nr:ABC transporter permease [Nesterenkonia sp. CL21]MDS2173918.1 ABC transporter permease [Nesterenkonia sp. CL21]